MKFTVIAALLATVSAGFSKTDGQNGFNQTNNFRKTQGKAAQRWNDDLYALAVGHTKYMISKGTISHDNWTVRAGQMRDKGIIQGSQKENVAYNSGYSDYVTTMINGWIKSTGHRANMLSNTNHAATAISYDGRTAYGTQLFGSK